MSFHDTAHDINLLLLFLLSDALLKIIGFGARGRERVVVTELCHATLNIKNENVGVQLEKLFSKKTFVGACKRGNEFVNISDGDTVNTVM